MIIKDAKIWIVGFLALSFPLAASAKNSTPQQQQANSNWWPCTGTDTPFDACKGYTFVSEDQWTNHNGYSGQDTTCVLTRPGTGMVNPEIYDISHHESAKLFFESLLEQVRKEQGKNAASDQKVGNCFTLRSSKAQGLQVQDPGPECQPIFAQWDKIKSDNIPLKLAVDEALGQDFHEAEIEMFSRAKDPSDFDKIMKDWTVQNQGNMHLITSPLSGFGARNNPFGSRPLTQAELDEAKSELLAELKQTFQEWKGTHVSLLNPQSSLLFYSNALRKFVAEKKADFMNLTNPGTGYPVFMRLPAQKVVAGQAPDWTDEQIGQAGLDQSTSALDQYADTQAAEDADNIRAMSEKYVTPTYKPEIEAMLADGNNRASFCGIAIAMVRENAEKGCLWNGVVTTASVAAGIVGGAVGGTTGGVTLPGVGAVPGAVVGATTAAAATSAALGAQEVYNKGQNLQRNQQVVTELGLNPNEEANAGNAAELEKAENEYASRFTDMIGDTVIGTALGAVGMKAAGAAFKGLLAASRTSGGQVAVNLARRTLYRALQPLDKPMSEQDWNAAIDRVFTKLGRDATPQEKQVLQDARTDLIARHWAKNMFDKRMSKLSPEEQDQVMEALMKYKGIKPDSEIKTALQHSEDGCIGADVGMFDDPIFQPASLACAL